ncbi:hypothetical protein LBSG162_03000 [Lentilactobacillus buchneri subsp. silagei]|nr:hypothetical protein Ltb232_09360 [Lentilactobacillus buchneri subsp. silagei]GED91195.1 hypothetical protein LBSG162_03000 [Lentilactobacillus buchneri subsp. silagei]GED94197.1 hypothetical protein LBSP_07570 [Lentilactobacillus buchneri subsp. silagei]
MNTGEECTCNITRLRFYNYEPYDDEKPYPNPVKPRYKKIMANTNSTIPAVFDLLLTISKIPKIIAKTPINGINRLTTADTQPIDKNAA